MFIVNGFKATLIQNNRNVQEDFYDDQDKQEVTIKVIPYNEDQAVKFGIYSVPEATGYFVLPRGTDVKEGDQLEYKDHIYSILKVQDNWLFNRIENIIVVVK